MHPTQMPGSSSPQRSQIPGSPSPQPSQILGSPSPRPSQIPGSPNPQPSQIPGSSSPRPSQIPGSPNPQPSQIPGSSSPQPSQIPSSPNPQPSQIPGSPSPKPSQMSGSSSPDHPSDHASSSLIQDHYLYASSTNVCNFVSVKLSSEGNYHLWKTQMMCLMESHNMVGLVDHEIIGPAASSIEMVRRYDSLLKGWIFGSVSENVLGAVVDLPSAKDVWDKLKSFYDATISPQQGTMWRDVEANYYNYNEPRVRFLNKDEREKLHKATLKGDWDEAESILKNNRDAVREVIRKDGSTMLHLAVGIGHNDFVENLLSYIKDEELLEGRSSDGSTALHIAAIVGNTYAVNLLVEKNKALLHIKDRKREEALHKAYENMHLDTIGYLFKASDDGGKTRTLSLPIANPGVEIGVDLLVNAISAKKYFLASELIEKFPTLVVKNNGVLMALAKTFPSGLDGAETLIYPSLASIWKRICSVAGMIIGAFFFVPMLLCNYLSGISSEEIKISIVPLLIPCLVIWLVYFVILMIPFIFLVLYFLLWKAASVIVAPIKHIEKKKREWEEAVIVLQLVCNEIDKLEFSGAHHPFYTGPILEAACQNAYKVVDEILFRSPEAIQCKNKSGYDIIQLAVLHRSDKIYNLIYDIGERKNLYRTVVDSSKNNILHLAGKLAPSHELSRRTGAALQLQRELQWCEEVKKFVFPTYISRENIFKETPNMVFTREHTDLLKEGEKWIKTTAESSSITAALITTIVFAAAITVPGGTNQETGTPLFRKDIAFTIFAISDAISLFASSTALLVFLSILTARFSEKDFLVSLPRRLLIGICALLLSTTAMMVAFSATLFVVFCDQKPWMLAPICGLALIPILFFVTLQFPLVIDLLWSTYLPIFGKNRKSARKSAFRSFKSGHHKVLQLQHLYPAPYQMSFPGNYPPPQQPVVIAGPEQQPPTTFLPSHFQPATHTLPASDIQTPPFQPPYSFQPPYPFQQPPNGHPQQPSQTFFGGQFHAPQQEQTTDLSSVSTDLSSVFQAMSIQKPQDNNLYMDTGASSHMSFN